MEISQQWFPLGRSRLALEPGILASASGRSWWLRTRASQPSMDGALDPCHGLWGASALNDPITRVGRPRRVGDLPGGHRRLRRELAPVAPRARVRGNNVAAWSVPDTDSRFHRSSDSLPFADVCLRSRHVRGRSREPRSRSGRALVNHRSSHRAFMSSLR